MNNTDMQFDDALNDCLEKVIRGMPVEACLAGYPEESFRLRPLLETAVAAKAVCAIVPSPEFRARARYEFRRALAQASQPKIRAGFQWGWRLATVLPAIIGLLLIGTGGVVAASSNSMPDQPLYRVKLATEQFQLRFTSSDTAKTKLYVMAADRRVREISSMAEQGKPALVESTTLRLTDDLNAITGLVSPTTQHSFELQNATVFGGAESTPAIRETTKSSQVIPPMAAAVPGALTTDNAAGTAGPSPASAQTVNIDPVLLKFLQDNAGKYPSDLQALLNSVPEASRPALLQAIAVTSNYQLVMSKLASNSTGNK